jgi:hypothetical protein
MSLIRSAGTSRRITRVRRILEVQTCNCLNTKGGPAKGKNVKVRCLRCELLAILEGKE